MIHYSLVCADEHAFEGWFRSSSDFDDQVAKGLVPCPVCGSTHVRRALMAPAIASGRRETREVPVPAVPETSAPVPVAAAPILSDPRAVALVEAMRELRKAVEANADYVGKSFPEEARKIHYGETEARGIYGEASAEDVKALLEEGVEIAPLPLLPEDRN
ncbi:DUF1178 family protein [Segnochrobactrum spirostomi]|uniref:DUF1178 family protein n=1 Tax=Segnochrobactrum spirostomi TaxID=2608987 RepID=A0A6A7Y241_9HYPH|nr:DUF1178 family protein [Segnochrobactrum spirostomi]MQT12181.1 DUF1178 family protein [Segnochrobactrum spirostomi]